MKKNRTIKILGKKGKGVVVNPEKSAKAGDILKAPGDCSLEEASLLVGNGRAVDHQAAPAKAKA